MKERTILCNESVEYVGVIFLMTSVKLDFVVLSSGLLHFRPNAEFHFIIAAECRRLPVED